ncbi:Uncharacterized protein APZ42_013094 [Daphnia magna]|uniref:Uncharacterized protein n=1 Tax=Daphnia magna TaxID=35525 RepID=A0A162R7W4_9CRUS|nr:Uncharacterized protein APZ42_013094 [Daphnia magna]
MDVIVTHFIIFHYRMYICKCAMLCSRFFCSLSSTRRSVHLPGYTRSSTCWNV